MQRPSAETRSGDLSQKPREGDVEEETKEEYADFKDLLEAPAEVARELRSRLKGNPRGEVEIEGKKFSTRADSGTSLLYVLEQKDPDTAQAFLKETQKEREEAIEKEKTYIGELAKEFGGKSWPTVAHLLEDERLSEILDSFSDLKYRAEDVLDKNSSQVINILVNQLKQIEDFFFEITRIKGGEIDIYKYYKTKKMCRGFTSKLELANLAFQIFKRKGVGVTSDTNEVFSRETERDQKKVVEETTVYINGLVEEFPDYWTGEAMLFRKEKINEIRNRFTDLMKRADTVSEGNLSQVIQRLDDILEDIDDQLPPLPDSDLPSESETDTSDFQYLYYRFARELILINLISQMFKD